MDTTDFADLNPMQRAAAMHGDGPLLVVAGAGTGKTKTLASRVAYLVREGVEPDRILLLTFTRRAAAEMLQRASRICGPDATRAVWGGTFHAVGNRLLRKYGRALGLADGFTVMDRADAADLMNMIRQELELGKDRRRFARKNTLVSIFSRMVNAQERLEETLRVHFPWCKEDIEGIGQVFDRYVDRKREQQVLDYDDLLLFWGELCAAPDVGRSLSERFDHVLVDEYQDTNAVQAQILRGMRATRNNIMVVGDDAQSIYSFRAATIRNILDFPEQFPGTTVVRLEQNYRSTRPILDASNAVMQQATQRFEKNLWSDRVSVQKPCLITCVDEPEQCDVVCRYVLEHLEQGTSLMNQAVLFRAGHHSAQLEVELSRRNIPFRKYGGLKFIEAAHVKDMLAVLRILENPYDQISWFRTLLQMEGVGPRTAGRILDDLGARRRAPGPGDSALPLVRLMRDPPLVPPAAREQFAELGRVLADCAGLPHQGDAVTESTEIVGGEAPVLAEQVERIRCFFEPIFGRIYDNPVIRLRDIDQLAQIASSYRSRGRFITDLTLDPPESTSDLAQPPFLEEDYLILSTMHSAKGCEWDVVHVIHAADGMIPSDMAVGDEAGVDEERRLFYVAMTRAKDHLYTYFPLRYYHHNQGRGDAHSYAQLTRFLPRSIHDLFEHRTARRQDNAESAVQTPVVADPYARVTKLWRN